MSQLTATGAASVTVLGTGNALPTPAALELPVPGAVTDDLTAATAEINAYFEPSEGMLVTFPDTLSVSEYFELARYGQVILSEGGRPHTFTAHHEPTAAGFIANEIDLARRSVILDDTDNRENRPVDSPEHRLLPPGPRPQHVQRVPRRGHDHEPHRRPPLVVRRRHQPERVAHPPGDRGVRLRVHAGQRAPGRPGRRRPPDRRQLQRPQLLPVHRHRRTPARRRRTRTAAARTARSSSSGSAPRCWPPSRRSTPTCSASWRWRTRRASSRSPTSSRACPGTTTSTPASSAPTRSGSASSTSPDSVTPVGDYAVLDSRRSSTRAAPTSTGTGRPSRRRSRRTRPARGSRSS